VTRPEVLTSSGQVTGRTREALHAADRAGWHVALVTGRPLPYVLPLVRELAVGEFIVAANGATVGEIATGAVLYQASLPGHVVLEALASARRAVPGLRAAITTPCSRSGWRRRRCSSGWLRSSRTRST
jgi:hydroxymethylpyrimidine pyrophosphatase-like HAD family hydrolase